MNNDSSHPTLPEESGQVRPEKMLVIGLDGATFDLIKPWAAEGALPTLPQVLRLPDEASEPPLQQGELDLTLHAHGTVTAPAVELRLDARKLAAGPIKELSLALLGSYHPQNAQLRLDLSAGLPQGKLLTGQDAVNTAKAFNERINFDGVVLTKLDGDTRGGAALTIKYTVEKPIKFMSSGEKMDTLDVFYPDRMAQRILGMGDIASLVEKAQQQYDEEAAKKLEKKIRKNQFDFQDFLDQLQQIKKMGNLKDLMGMIPGVGKAIKDVDVDNDSFKGIEAIIQSMTPEERANPDLIDQKRKNRIAKGCGKDMNEVNAFMKQFEQMKKMMSMMNKMPMGGFPGMKGMRR